MSSTGVSQAISHLSVVTVNVSDQDAALRYYTECIGFEKRTDAPMGEGLRWLTVAPAGAATAVVLARGFGEGGAPLGTNTGLVLETDDIDAAYQELSGRGVRFTKQPAREFFGGWAEFVDQDGNIFGLHSNQTAG